MHYDRQIGKRNHYWKTLPFKKLKEEEESRIENSDIFSKSINFPIHNILLSHSITHLGPLLLYNYNYVCFVLLLHM